ncbi:SEC12-like protein 2 [Cucumis melo var. makuwa]|uniref:SEC12-like protein 2 n=1 Tax=Cucumis melo var. makuwa TaxID=1194695 RepID=A0A5A7TCI6_CUCMM|nr:SEC12-like protein 2 [Cucumis melo var. makuwa]TYK17799.1 SEC12-like protein 2 [Cucumis melo var. makuwa]TYK19108.1 SEC12-like protein 2 [Cucumis melo var. makuwa]TYK29923.1 SEC12-like protein 2 [Cucumis melo var. makuwa]
MENDVSAAWFPSTSLKSKHQPSQYEDLPHQSTDADIFVTDNKIVPSHPASYYVATVGGGEEGQSGISNVFSYSLISIFNLARSLITL